jgi:intein/homing endonuclease
MQPHDLNEFPVGSAVFYRSYSRPNENGYESWEQCIDRAMQGLRRLAKFTDEEYDLIYRNAIECKALPSGRWMWCGGSEWIEKQENFYGGYNCTSNEVDEPSVFGWLMGLAMQGCGTGAVLEQRCIDKLPPISRKLKVSVVGDFGEGDEPTTRIEYDAENDIYKLIVGDSRQGWVDSYQFLIDLAMGDNLYGTNIYREINLVIDVSNVRESGKKLKGFGGTSNPIKLKEFYPKIANILNDTYGRQLTAEECCLLIDEAAIVVVAGNVRRCIHEDTLVLTIDGQKAIKDIEVGDFVITPKGKQKVLNKFYQGKQLVTKIKLNDETEILATENHRLYVHGVAWVKVCDIKDNDELLKIINNETGEPYPISIKEISRNYSEVETYDIEVDIDNCFYANGILSHNSAGMRQFDREQPLLKNNLWKQDDNGNWSIDPKRDALRMANHTRVFHTKPDYETIKEAVTIQFQSGEGAIQYVNEAIARANVDIFNTPEKKLEFIAELDNGNGRQYLENMGVDNVEHRLHRYGLNPCFRGDMRLLTVDGYKRFDELDGTEPYIINVMGQKVKSKVWCSGEKETVCLSISNGQKIYCTPDHRFLIFDDNLDNEYECEAKDLLGKHLQQFGDDAEIVSVIDVKPDGIHKVYDFTEPVTHWGVVEGFVVHNCGEIIGSSGFFCNLSEVHLNQINPFDFDSQIDAFNAAALDVVALLNHEFDNERWKKSREIDPIVGVSITGLFDFFVNAFGRDWLLWWQEGRPEYFRGQSNNYVEKFIINHFEMYGELMELAYKSNRKHSNKADYFRVIEREYLKLWKSVVDAKVAEYCTTHNLKVPNRCTTFQPAGSKSLLSNASPGWHPPKATRYLRRVTYRKNDPVALTLRDFGYNIVPSQSDKDENGRLLDDPFDPRCTEWLVEIPVEVSWANMGDGIDINQFSAIAQFDFYMQVQKHYTAHNTSATLEMRENEIEPLAKAIYNAIQRNDGYISAAILSRFDDNSTFPRLPFEPISESKFNELSREVIERRKATDFVKTLNEYAIDRVAEVAPSGCDSDACLMPEINHKQ